MDIPLIGKIILYADLAIFGLLCILLFWWQFQVMRGGSMKNPDGSFDDWHQQKIFYGMAVADIFVAVPLTIAGIVLILFSRRLGFYFVGMASFWYVWANLTATATSLKFEKPKITLMWFIVFPLGGIIGLIYIVWSIFYFKKIFLAG